MALSLVGTLWLIVPAYLELLQSPFALVSEVALLEMPIVLVSALLWCFALRGRVGSRIATVGSKEGGRLLFFAFMAYFWSLIDDGPVGFDSVFTWPEVTSGLQHTFLEILLHALTLGFMYLAIREALKGTGLASGGRVKVSLLVLAAFWASYAQNTPLSWVQALTASNWYALDAVEHTVSVAFFALAIRQCALPRGSQGVAVGSIAKDARP